MECCTCYPCHCPLLLGSNFLISELYHRAQVGMRPPLSLAAKMLQCVKKRRHASSLELKGPKHFPGLWKIATRERAKSSRHLSHRRYLLSFGHGYKIIVQSTIDSRL